MPKLFRISKDALHHTIKRCLYFLDTKFLSPEFRGLPRTSALKTARPAVYSEYFSRNPQNHRYQHIVFDVDSWPWTRASPLIFPKTDLLPSTAFHLFIICAIAYATLCGLFSNSWALVSPSSSTTISLYLYRSMGSQWRRKETALSSIHDDNWSDIKGVC